MYKFLFYIGSAILTGILIRYLLARGVSQWTIWAVSAMILAAVLFIGYNLIKK